MTSQEIRKVLDNFLVSGKESIEISKSETSLDRLKRVAKEIDSNVNKRGSKLQVSSYAGGTHHFVLNKEVILGK